MTKFTKVIALTAAMTMLFSTVVMAASSPSTSSAPAPAPVASAPAVSNSVSTANLAPTTVVTAYTAGVAAETPGVAVAPVNAATVNYANLGAKILVSPTAVVFKSMTLMGDAKNVCICYLLHILDVFI